MKIKFGLIAFAIFIFVNNVYSQDTSQSVCKTRLSGSLNSYSPVIVPVLSIQDNLMFFDYKVHPQNVGGTNDNDDVWFSERISDNAWTEPQNLGYSFNTEYSNVLFSINPDLSKCLVYKAKNQIDGAFYSAKVNGTEITSLEPLNISNYYNDSINFYGNLSYDGRVLIISASRKDAIGDLDLYISFKYENTNRWSEPKNLGKVINTRKRESSPFLSYDKKTLYFSSNGHSGYGNSDIFVTRRLDDSWQNWSKPENLGETVNSKFDDTGIYLTPLADSAVIVSNDTSALRSGLYFVCMPEKLMPEPYILLTGKVFEPGMKLAEKEFVLNEKRSDSTINSFVSNPKTGTYYWVLPTKTNETVVLEQPGFQKIVFPIENDKLLSKPRKMYYDFVLKNVDDTNRIPDRNEKLIPSKEADTLSFNVYFEFNSFDITKQYKTSIDKIFGALADKNIKKVIITGNTDIVGTDLYNYKLGQNRADAVRKYIINKFNISPKLIKTESNGKKFAVENQYDSDRNSKITIITE